MSQASKGGLWPDDLMDQPATGNSAWRIEKFDSSVDGHLPFFPDQASGRVYEQLLFNLPINLHCMDGAGRILSMNRQWMETLGYALNDVSGRHWHELLSHESRAYLTQQIYPRYLQTNAIRNVEIVMFRKDGQKAHMLMSALGYRGIKGRVERSIVILQEVTARKSAETALQRSEQRFRGAFEAAAHGIVLVAPNGRILAYNPAFQEMSGRSDEELSSLAFDESVHRDDKAIFLSGMRKLIEGDTPAFKMELRYVGGDKPVAWGFTSVSLVRNERNDIDHLVVQIVDTTSRRQAERQLQQAQKMEAVGQLTGGLAHDFNNLLTVIIGNLTLVETAVKGDDKARHRLLEATEAAQKGSDLTRQLLTFSRHQEVEQRQVQVNELIANVHPLVARTIGESIDLQLSLTTDDGLVLIDPTQFETSVLNLAINARDAMPSGGQLTIETQHVVLDQAYVAENPDVKPGLYVMIAVTDSGTGIPKAIIDKVFQPFFTTKPAGKGSGLGLAMVYGFATHSGGHLRIYSEEGHGTAVKLYLPCKGIVPRDETTQAVRKPATAAAVVPAPPIALEAPKPQASEGFEFALTKPQAAPPNMPSKPQAAQPAAASPQLAAQQLPATPKPAAPARKPPAVKITAAPASSRKAHPRIEVVVAPVAPPSPARRGWTVPKPAEGTAPQFPHAPSAPPKAATPPPQPAPSARPPRPRNARPKILVVEDQEGVREVASGFLAGFGYDVIEAADGITALTLLQQQRDIDLMFTDVVMPGGLNGFDLAQAAQQIDPDLLIVHTSGYPKGAIVHMEEPRLKDNIIMKPYRKEELHQVMRETLAKRGF